jgi:hypothetical protein
MNKSKDPHIIINPELLPNIVKNGEHDLFCLWNAAKQVDYNSSGIINQSDFINIAIHIFGFNKIIKVLISLSGFCYELYISTS